jgi:integrase/recombinase XerD
MAGAVSRVSRVLVTGPLAPFAEDYRRELRERGYTERSVVNELRQVARFSRWLQAGRLSVWELGADRMRSSLAGSAPSGVTGPSGHGRGWCACSTCCASWGC